MSDETQAVAVTLTELLRRIPADASYVWTEPDGLKATHYHPIGRYAQEAADEIDRLRAVTRIGPDTIDHSMVICPHCTSQFPAISVNDQKRESDMYTAYEAALAELASLRAERDGLRAAIKAHNDECEQLCGVGDQEGVACKYRPYFPRHCPSCPRNSMLIDEYGKRIDTTATGEG